MKKRLSALKGEKLQKLPFELNWIADLISYEWPLVSIFTDKQKRPFLYTWMDGSEKADRYLIAEITLRNLEGYLLKVVTYEELFKNAVNDEYFLFDITKVDGKESVFTQVSFSGLQANHKPEKDLFLEFEEQRDLDLIKAYFNLTMNLDQYRYGEKNIHNRAKETKSEVVNIHLNSTNDLIQFGVIQSHILGQVLVEYNKMAEASALKIYEDSGLRKSSKNWQPGERESIIALAHTSYLAMAASFDVELTPVKTKIVNNGTAMEQIAGKIFQLMNIGEDFNQATVTMEAFPQEMLNAYQNFLLIIKKYGITVAMQYGSPEKETTRKEYFDAIKSSNIIKQLRAISEKVPQELKHRGRFVEFHLEKLTFEFRSETGVVIKGKIKKDIAEVLYIQIFSNTYDIVVERIFLQARGKLGLTVRDTIVSCIKVAKK
jgi:hypothetical protein